MSHGTRQRLARELGGSIPYASHNALCRSLRERLRQAEAERDQARLTQQQWAERMGNAELACDQAHAVLDEAGYSRTAPASMDADCDELEPLRLAGRVRNVLCDLDETRCDMVAARNAYEDEHRQHMQCREELTHTKLALSGRTVSCGACERMAKERDEAQAELQRLRDAEQQVLSALDWTGVDGDPVAAAYEAGQMFDAMERQHDGLVESESESIAEEQQAEEELTNKLREVARAVLAWRQSPPTDVEADDRLADAVTDAEDTLREVAEGGAPSGPTEGEWRCKWPCEDSDRARVARHPVGAAVTVIECNVTNTSILTPDDCDEMAAVLRACAAKRRAEGGAP